MTFNSRNVELWPRSSAVNIPLAVTPSKEAEKQPKPTSLEKITVDESGGGRREEPLNESMLQYQNLNISKRAEEKWRLWSHAERDSIARYICRVNRRDNGPTARATEVREPAILANSRYEEDLSRIAELRRLLSFRTLASGIWKVMAIVLITKPSHSPICTGSQWGYPHSRENPKS